ncbi:hypothetical protein [Abyssogena phaseoliformis symbiont]|uniref:hypothetical protein n=1 Tax=Abyssogena phaseoliformis symbiont TaxID=596095 RepID=UPI001916AF2D|nr:hypothetical protein [Abyssogena phaseoliformis symbiont]
MGTLSQLADVIAQQHGLKIRANTDILTGIIQQYNKSDTDLLNRLAKDNNLVFNIKNNLLYLMDKSADMPYVCVDIDRCIDSDITYSNKKLYRSCKAVYHNTKTTKQLNN